MRTFINLIGVNTTVGIREALQFELAVHSPSGIPECELNFYNLNTKTHTYSCSGRAFFGGVFCGC